MEFLCFSPGLLNYIEYIFSTRGKGINVNLVRKRDEKDAGDEKEWELYRGRGGLINCKLVVSPTFSPSSPDRHQSREIVSTDSV